MTGRHSPEADKAGDVTVWDLSARPRVKGYVYVGGLGELLGDNAGPMFAPDAVIGNSGEPQFGVARAALVLSPRGDTLAAVDHDQRVRLWDVESGRQLGQPLLHDPGLVDLEFSPDGKMLASASDDGTVRLWDVEPRRPLKRTLVAPTVVDPEAEYEGAIEEMTAVAFGSNGILFSASMLAGLERWDVKAGRRDRHAVERRGHRSPKRW